jgi:hypothetical protein
MTEDLAAQHRLPDSDTRLIAATDQLLGRILIFDFDLGGSPAKDRPTEAVLSWRPSRGNGFGESTPGWGRPSEVRVRRGPGGALYMLVADSYGLVAVVGPDGRRLWSVDVGAAANPHAAELLPDGTVVVAASTGGWIRCYKGLAQSHGADYQQWDLASAHGTLWDPEREVIWVLGADLLCSLRVDAAGEACRIAQVTCDPLPSGGGHDLQPVHGDGDLLWITTSSAVYQYSKRERSWSTSYPGAPSVNRAHVKSIGSDPATGHVLQTIPDPAITPDWLTGAIDVFTPDRHQLQPGGHFYKARFWNADYH